jgi:hypothetical protein
VLVTEPEGRIANPPWKANGSILDYTRVYGPGTRFFPGKKTEVLQLFIEESPSAHLLQGRLDATVFVVRGNDCAVASHILAQQLAVRLGNPQLQVDGTLGGLGVRVVD